jgi:hypothetical protein
MVLHELRIAEAVPDLFVAASDVFELLEHGMSFRRSALSCQPETGIRPYRPGKKRKRVADRDVTRNAG